MIFIYTEQQNINSYWVDEFSDDFGVKSIHSISELNLNHITNKDIFVVDLDDFETIEKSIEYIENISSKINTIALVDTPKLAHGTLMIKKGCKSYIGKRTSKIILMDVIKTVMESNVWLYPELMNYIIKNITVDTKNKEKKDFSMLSAKELEVANLVALGNSNKEIAEQLNIQLVTVKKHIGHIFEKLKVKDRVALAICINQNK